MVGEVVKAGVEAAETVVETVGETGVEAIGTAVEKTGGSKVTYIVIGGITFLVIGGIIVGVVAKKRKDAKNPDKRNGHKIFGRHEEPDPETDAVEMEAESVD